MRYRQFKGEGIIGMGDNPHCLACPRSGKRPEREIPSDGKDALILQLSERLWICSRLLTCAAERLGWDDEQVKELVAKLRSEINERLDFASR